MDMNKLREAASRLWNAETLPALKTFVSRESLSTDFDPEWEKHGILTEVCREAAAWGARMLPGGTYDVQQEPGRTPALIFSVPGTGLYAGREEDTVFFYGHLDKQPPATGWSEGLGPFTPVVRDGKLYGRGCSDDGYSVYAALTAIRALEDAGIPHPRAVGLIETREESGSNDLEHYLRSVSAAPASSACSTPEPGTMSSSGSRPRSAVPARLISTSGCSVRGCIPAPRAVWCRVRSMF